MQSLKYLFLFVAVLGTAQTFNYNRDWGTYLGGVNGKIGRLFEDKNTLVLDGVVKTANISPVPSAAYYNQFITPNEQGFQFGLNSYNVNFYVSRVSSSGTALQSFGYRSSSMIHRDKDGNYFKIVSNGIPTAGAWLSFGVETAPFNNYLLEKYDANNNLLWRTYIPNANNASEYVNIDSDCLITDAAGNIYIKGYTQWQNLGDAGTAYPTYSTNFKGFVVKLNPIGQKIWATYVPNNAYNEGRFCVYGNNLYFTSSYNINSSTITATQGAFQVSPAANVILNLNATTGALQWVTFYASPNENGNTTIQSIAAQADGLYILGFINPFNFNTNGYYASSGAYQSQQPGGIDLYIAKFGMQGERIWGTYYGSPDDDGNYGWNGSGHLDVKYGKILITHLQNGAINMATPGAYLNTKPNSSNSDIVFSMFDTDGNRLFTSYYGAYIANVGTQPVYVYGQFSNKSDAFFLYGYTPSENGFTQNALQNSIISPSSSTYTYGPYVSYLAKFSANLLSTEEAAKQNDLKLFDNPNNGAFSLKGSILSKEQCSFTIYDSSGRMLADIAMGKAEVQNFNLSKILSKGNYVLTLKNSKKEPVKIFKMLVK